MLLRNGEREEAGKLIGEAISAAKKAFGPEHSKTKEILELREKILSE